VAKRQVLAAAEDLADPPGRDAHPGRELSPGQATLAHMEGDLVGQLRDLSVPAVGAPLAAGQDAAVKTQYVEGK
jgi:hypothetical protein